MTGENIYSSSHFFTASTSEMVELTVPEWLAEYMSEFYLEVDDSILAYQGSLDSPAPFAIWRTTDANNWEYVGEPRGFPHGYQPQTIVGSSGVYVTVLNEIIELGPDFLTYRSENGIDWTPTEGLPLADGSYGQFGSEGDIHRVGSGWVWVDYDLLSIFTSPDGQHWEPIDTSRIPKALGGRTSLGGRILR